MSTPTGRAPHRDLLGSRPRRTLVAVLATVALTVACVPMAAVSAAPPPQPPPPPTCTITVTGAPPGADPGTCTVGAAFQSSLGTTYPLAVTNTPITNTSWTDGGVSYSIGAFGGANVDMTAPILIDPTDCMNKYGFAAISNGNAIATSNPGPYACKLDVAAGSGGSGVTVIKWTDWSTNFGYCHWYDASGKICMNSGPVFNIAINWNPVATSLTPSFTATPASTTPGVFQFVSNSTDAPGATMDYSWDFGDGSAATGAAATHTYTKPGSYTATLKVTDDQGGSASVSQPVVVAAPKLQASLEFVDAHGTVLSSVSPSVGDNVSVRLTLSASSEGVGSISGVAPAAGSDLVSAVPSAAVSIGSPAPALQSPLSLAGGQSKSFTFPVQVLQSGVVTFSAAFAGKDDAGNTVTSGTDQVSFKSPVMNVSLRAAPDPSELTIASDGSVTPETVTVTETVTNITGSALTNVEAGPLTLANADPDQSGNPFPALVTGDNSTANLGGLAPSQSVTLTRTVKVSDAAALALSAPVSADQGTATGFGTLTAKLPSLAVNWTMDPTFDDTAATVVTNNAQLHPAGGYGFGLKLTNGCNAANSATVKFTVAGAPMAPTPKPVTGNPCAWTFRRPKLDPFTLDVQATTQGGSKILGSERIKPRQFVIVAVGDSLSSGEGLPGSTWISQQYHRSLDSGSAKAALALENDNKHSSVAYISVACSGATTYQGLLGPFVGIEPGAPMAAQFSQVSAIVQDTPIDSVVFSIGANDIKFGDVATACVTSPVSGCDASTAVDGTTIGQLLLSGFGDLPAHYADVNSALTNLGVPASRVITLTYPDSTHKPTFTNGQQDFCGAFMNQSSWRFNYLHVLVPLNNAVMTAAQQFGWNVVAGAEQAFAMHGYCATKANRWITTLPESSHYEGGVAGALHPNEAGYDWYGQQILGELRQQLIQPDGEPVPVSPIIPSDTSASLDSTTATPGTTDTVNGSGFLPGETVDATLHSTPVYLGSTIADALGNVHFTFTIPADTTPGSHEIILTGQRSGRTVTIPITITPAPTPISTHTPATNATPTATLPATGSPVRELTALGTLLILAGWLLLRTRHRHPATPT